MKKPRGASWRRRAALALPRIEPDVVVIAARGDKSRVRAIPLCKLESEHTAIEVEGALEISYFEMYVADTHRGVDWALFHHYTFTAGFILLVAHRHGLGLAPRSVGSRTLLCARRTRPRVDPSRLYALKFSPAYGSLHPCSSFPLDVLP